MSLLNFTNVQLLRARDERYVRQLLLLQLEHVGERGDHLELLAARAHHGAAGGAQPRAEPVHEEQHHEECRGQVV